eukprot:2081178-Amphidinium_carterae.2
MVAEDAEEQCLCLTHLPPVRWTSTSVLGTPLSEAGASPAEREELPLIALDFGFLNGSHDADRPITFVAAADSSARGVFAMPLTRKGATEFATAKLVAWLRSLGHRRMIFQSD